MEAPVIAQLRVELDARRSVLDDQAPRFGDPNPAGEAFPLVPILDPLDRPSLAAAFARAFTLTDFAA